jgi:hypothetical protein
MRTSIIKNAVEIAGFSKQNRRVDRHEGSPKEWLQRHQAACKQAIKLGPIALAEVHRLLFQRVRDDRNLGVAADAVARHSGKTPGPDGYTVTRVRKKWVEKWSFVRKLRDELRFTHQVLRRDAWRAQQADTRPDVLGEELRGKAYKPGDTRLVMVPKKSGKGHRPIRIGNFRDRVVQRAILQVVQPLIEPRFRNFSFGYRPARGRFHALARAETYLDAGRTVVAVEDLADAFGHIPRERALQVLAAHLPDPHLISLIDEIIRTPEGMGVPQGNGLSPLVLNVWLDKTLDRKWHPQTEGVELVRVADDLMLFGPDAVSTSSARQRLEGLARSAGFRFKGTQGPGVIDLARGGTAHWLGFDLRWDERRGLNGGSGLIVRVAEASWERLRENLRKATMKEPTPEQPHPVRDSLRQWVRQQGATWPHEHHTRFVNQVLSATADAGVNWSPKPGAILALWHDSYMTWKHVRQSFRPNVELV